MQNTTFNVEIKFSCFSSIRKKEHVVFILSALIFIKAKPSFVFFWTLGLYAARISVIKHTDSALDWRLSLAGKLKILAYQPQLERQPFNFFHWRLKCKALCDVWRSPAAATDDLQVDFADAVLKFKFVFSYFICKSQLRSRQVILWVLFIKTK